MKLSVLNSRNKYYNTLLEAICPSISTKSWSSCFCFQTKSKCQTNIIMCVEANTNDPEKSFNVLASKRQYPNDDINDIVKLMKMNIRVMIVIGIGSGQFNNPMYFKWSLDNFSTCILSEIFMFVSFDWNCLKLFVILISEGFRSSFLYC